MVALYSLKFMPEIHVNAYKQQLSTKILEGIQMYNYIGLYVSSM